MKNVEEVYPLSPMQEGMLYHSLRAPQEGLYVDQYAVRLRGALDAAAFAEAWRRTVERHSTFRTAFVWEGLSKPVQVVRRQVDLPWDELDWRDEAAPTERLNALARTQRSAGLELARAPVMQFTLAHIGEDDALFLWSYHHLLLDGWSVGTLQEVFAQYQALRDGRTLALPPAPRYSAYIAWLKEQDHEKAEGYWRSALEGWQHPTPLPRSRAVPRRGGPATHVLPLVLPADQTAAVQEAARTSRLTVNTLLQGALALTLGHYAGVDEVTYGSVTSGRPPTLEGADRTLGLFINTLPTRIQLQRDRSLAEWLQAIQSDQVEARQYAYVPLYKMQRWAQCPPDRQLFDVLLDVLNFAGESSAPADGIGLEMETVHLNEAARLPLTLTSMPGEELRIDLKGRSDRLDEAALRRVSDTLGATLRAFGNGLNVALGSIKMEPAPSSASVSVNESQPAALRDLERAHGRIARHARQTPDATALVSGTSTLTYGALEERATQLAGRLRATGVGPEDRVVVHADEGVEACVAIYAALKAEAAVVPVGLDVPTARLAAIVEDAGAVAMLVAPSAMGSVATVEQAVSIPVVSTAAHSVSEATVSEAGVSEAGAPEPDEQNGPTASGATLAYVAYVSRPRGGPAGVMVSHRSLCSSLDAMTESAPLTLRDRVLQAAPLTSDAVLLEVLWALTSGAQVVTSGQQAPAVAEAILRQRVTVARLAPSVLEKVLRIQEAASATGGQHALTAVCSAEEELTTVQARALAKAMPGVHLHNHYGTAETAMCATATELHPEQDVVSLGQPLAGTLVHVLDQGGSPIAVGVPGELHVGGGGVARGYLGRPAETAASFLPDPSSRGGRLFRTGDHVCRMEDGSLQFLGRRDRRVKLGAVRVELDEVEAVMRAVDGVGEAVAFVEGGSERHLAVVAEIDGSEPKSQDLAEAAARWLPAPMRPRSYDRVDQLPRDVHGRVDHARAERERRTRPKAETNAAPNQAPQTRIEQTVAGIWRSVLQLDEIGLHDNFFDLGGHSLTAVAVFGKLKEELGVELQLVHLFEHPTVSALAKHLAAAAGPPAAGPSAAGPSTAGPSAAGPSATPNPATGAASASRRQGRRRLLDQRARRGEA
ncbi:MAG: condensation domain-containing protein [Bacteroidota bacterium]